MMEDNSNFNFSKGIEMNIFLLVLQFLLAMHTGAGAYWKFSHPAGETMPSLGVLPNGVWIAMAVIEILCAIGLILPAIMKKHKKWVPISALVIAAEMLLLCGIHISTGHGSDTGPMVYWLIVAAFSAFIAFGRLKLKP
jgi:hypothetical protein